MISRPRTHRFRTPLPPAALLLFPASRAGWPDRGWRLAGDGKNMARRVRTGGELARVYAISHEAVMEADA